MGELIVASKELHTYYKRYNPKKSGMTLGKSNMGRKNQWPSLGKWSATVFPMGLEPSKWRSRKGSFNMTSKKHMASHRFKRWSIFCWFVDILCFCMSLKSSVSCILT